MAVSSSWLSVAHYWTDARKLTTSGLLPKTKEIFFGWSRKRQIWSFIGLVVLFKLGKKRKKTTAEEASPTITSPPNLRSHTHTPPLSYDEESADVADASTEASPSNDRYESDGVITLEGDNNPFIAQTVEDSTKYKIVLSWSHAIDKVVINNFSENDWVTQNGHNISTDFRNFQLKSIEKLKTNPTLSYAKEISLILCLSSIMYCNEFKPEYLECSEKTWSEVRPRSLTPKELPTVADLVIIEYSRLLSDNNYSIQNGATTDCFEKFFYLLIFPEFSLVWANGESESSKERRLLDGHNHGRKPDFRILTKIDDTDRELMFGEIKPPHCLNTVNKSIIKLAEFMKGSLDLIINIYGYVAGLETYGILICGLYRFNLLSKVLFPTENANFLNIITVVSTLYSLLERVKSTICTINLFPSSTQSSNPLTHIIESQILHLRKYGYR
ncbi:uncharacterized protein OCT59_012639 [Rhizophagus irregularis]|uniref:uncharacterized protein n=1 Tax=Rhizophagus irregularis TaxID=588596 RepID=UPI003317322D|nr:hypothetical protein OCT59_012639 [Rhizophagus irregularis]